MTVQVIADAEKNYVVHITDEVSPYTIDVSTLNPSSKYGPVTRIRLDQVKYTTDANIQLDWDATANEQFLDLAAGQENFDYRDMGGINNSKAAGFTGDVILTTAATDWTTTLYFTKKFD